METLHGDPPGPGRDPGPLGGDGTAVVPVGARLQELCLADGPAHTIGIPEDQSTSNH